MKEPTYLCPQCIQIACPEQVEGNLEAFWDYAKLQVLDLEGTKIEGSIDVFEFTPSLEVLNMAGTLGTISGNLEVFEETPRLKVLRLNASEMEGNIEAFGLTQGLRELSLVNALNVTGSLRVLVSYAYRHHACLANLEKFVLINSPHVTGRVSDFRGSQKLQEIRIENAEKIDGDVNQVLLSIPTLRRIILKGISIVSNLTEMDHKFTHELPDLQFSLSELHLEPIIKNENHNIQFRNRLAGELWLCGFVLQGYLGYMCFF